jgi:hypothetical protein
MNFDITKYTGTEEIIPDNYKNYYLKGYSGNLTNCCLYKACCGRSWRIEKEERENSNLFENS